MKVSPDTQCTLVKQTSRQGNSHCFRFREMLGKTKKLRRVNFQRAGVQPTVSNCAGAELRDCFGSSVHNRYYASVQQVIVSVQQVLRQCTTGKCQCSTGKHQCTRGEGQLAEPESSII